MGVKLGFTLWKEHKLRMFRVLRRIFGPKRKAVVA
jgi:hypothetical protein